MTHKAWCKVVACFCFFVTDVRAPCVKIMTTGFWWVNKTGVINDPLGLHQCLVFDGFKKVGDGLKYKRIWNVSIDLPSGSINRQVFICSTLYQIIPLSCKAWLCHSVNSIFFVLIILTTKWQYSRKVIIFVGPYVSKKKNDFNRSVFTWAYFGKVTTLNMTFISDSCCIIKWYDSHLYRYSSLN